MGSPQPNRNVNNLAFGNANTFNQQQGGLQSNIMGGLEGAQGRSNQVFDAAFGGYQGLLSGLQGGGGVGSGGRGGGGGMQSSIDAINALGGPGNPWAGGLGRDIRARQDSLLPGFYDRIKSEQTRLQNIQGGYNPGFTSQMAKLAREQAQTAQKSKLETEIQLGERSAQAQAAQAAFDLQKQGMISGIQRSAAAAAAAGDQQAFRNQMAVLDAMTGLRGQAPAEVAMYLQAGLGNIQNRGIGNQQVGQLMQYNQPTLPGWQRALGAIGSIGGAVAPFFMGGGGGQNQFGSGVTNTYGL